MNAIFTPYLGTEKQITNAQHSPGYLYFASDTGKMYLDTGTERIAVGGGGATFYYSKTVIRDGYDGKTWTLSYDELEDNGARPKINDLLINEDGHFLRVVNFDDNNIYTSIVSVSGVAGGGGGSAGYSLKFAYNDVREKYFVEDEENAYISFTISQYPPQEGNKISSIGVYMIGDSPTPIELLRDNTEREFDKKITLNLAKYLNQFKKGQATQLYIQVTDYANNRFEFTNYPYYINIVTLSIQSTMDNILAVEDDDTLIVTCATVGQNGLPKITVHYDVTQEDGTPMFSKTQSQNTPGEVPDMYLVFENENMTFHGVCNLSIYADITIIDNDQSHTITSNTINYKIIHYYTGGLPEPILCVLQPIETEIEQYSYYNVQYRVFNGAANATDKYNINLITGVKEVNQEQFNTETITANTLTMHTWTTYFDTIGKYEAQIGIKDKPAIYLNTITVKEYNGDMPTIDTALSALVLNLSANNRNNNELNKDVWQWKGISTQFNPLMHWGEIDGWQKDSDDVGYLHLTAGAGLTIPNFKPFAVDATATGYTIELDFKFSGITDYQKPLIHCVSYNGDKIAVGFQLTGDTGTIDSKDLTATNATISEDESEDQIIKNTGIQGRTSRFIPDERIHLSWVIQKKENNDYPMVKAYINGVLSGITQYAKTDTFVETNTNPALFTIDSTYADIDIYNIRAYSQAFSDQFILNNYLATSGSNQERTDKYLENNILKYDSIKQRNVIDLAAIEKSTYNMKVPYMKLTGGAALAKNKITGKYELKTGSINEARLPYEKKDYRLMQVEFIDPTGQHKEFIENISISNGTDTSNIVDTSKEGWYVKKGGIVYGQGTSSMEYAVKNLRIKFKSQDVEVYDGAYPVDLICLKADYMESSGTHNTTTANMVYDLYKALNLQSPAQEYYHSDKYPGEEVKDLVTAIRGFPIVVFYSPTGEEGTYEYIGKYNFNLDKATPEPFGFFNYPEADVDAFNKVIAEEDKNLIKEHINNGTAFGWKYDEENDEVISTIHCFEFKNNDTYLVQFNKEDGNTFDDEWFRFNKSFESRYPDEGDILDAYAESLGLESGDDLSSEQEFEILANNANSWKRVVSWVDETRDDLERFKNEFDQYFNLKFTLFYYILTHVFLMIDSRAKNMMMATWDDKIWYPILYDMDTMLGLNNFGFNKFYYSIEDTAANVFNSYNSTFWNNFREAFKTEVDKYYDEMTQKGFNATNILTRYNDQHANLLNETFFNEDSYYKYQRIFTEGFWRVKDDVLEEVGPGKDDRLYASQGRRSMHRIWWLKNRFNLFNSKHKTTSYINSNNAIQMRVFTPKVSNENEPTAEDLKIQASLNAVPSSRTFTLIPNQNAYMAVGSSGGNNAYSNIVTFANQACELDAPPGEGNETETYIYGIDILKDIGDLSNKYISQFVIKSGSTPLTRLLVGNETQGYYNNVFGTHASLSAIPYLEELNYTGCEKLVGALDASTNKKLKKILACNTAITSLSLPNYSLIEELRLPNTLGTLHLNNCIYLTDDKFTVGKINYNNVENEDGTSSIVKTYENDFSNLTDIYIENTPIDSYTMLKSIPEKTVDGNLIELTYYISGFNWTITDINDINISVDNEGNSVYTIPVLERLLNSKTQNNYEHKVSLFGNIHFNIANLTEAFDAQALYDSYWDKYPNITFTYEDTMNIIPSFKVTLKKPDGSIVWEKQVAQGDYITEDFFQDGPYGAYKTPTSYDDTVEGYRYIFNNEWYVNQLPSEENTNPTIFTTEQMMTNNNEAIQSNIIFYIKYDTEILNSVVNFYDENGNLYEDASYTVQWKEYLNEPAIFPYKEYDGDNLYERYGFKGFVEKDSDVIMDLTTIKAAKLEYNFYAYFEPESVYIPTDIKYFEGINFDAVNLTVTLTPNSRYMMQGKITIPKEYAYNGKTYKVIALQEFSNKTTGGLDNNKEKQLITHLFFEKDSVITDIFGFCFAEITTLKFVEFPKTLTSLGQAAFTNCRSLESLDLSNTLLQTIQENCFQGAFASNDSMSVTLNGASLQYIGNRAFGQLLNTHFSLYLGNKDDFVTDSLDIAQEAIHSNIVNASNTSLFIDVVCAVSDEEYFKELLAIDSGVIGTIDRFKNYQFQINGIDQKGEIL